MASRDGLADTKKKDLLNARSGRKNWTATETIKLLEKVREKKIVVEGKFGPSGGKVTDAS